MASTEQRMLFRGMREAIDKASAKGKEVLGGVAEKVKGVTDGALRQAGAFVENPAGKTREALDSAKEVVGGMQEEAGKLVRFTREELGDLSGKVNIAELKEKGIEYLQTIVPELGELFQDALQGGAKAVKEILESPAVWDFFRTVLEKISPEERRAFLRGLDALLPGLGISWDLHRAELAERIFADEKDTAAHEEAVQIGMKEKKYGMMARAGRWLATVRVSPWKEGQIKKERKLIGEEYARALNIIAQKYPFLTEEMIRETVRAKDESPKEA